MPRWSLVRNHFNFYVFQKNPLGTITNSPVKKQQTKSDNSAPKIAGPQRVLSLKKSPHMMRTRRQAEQQEQNSLTEQDESPAECKVA